MINQKNAEKEVIRLFASWPGASSPTPHPEKYAFFLDLERERPELLDFRAPAGDKWQVVQTWLAGL